MSSVSSSPLQQEIAEMSTLRQDPWHHIFTFWSSFIEEFINIETFWSQLESFRKTKPIDIVLTQGIFNRTVAHVENERVTDLFSIPEDFPEFLANFRAYYEHEIKPPKQGNKPIWVWLARERPQNYIVQVPIERKIFETVVQYALSPLSIPTKAFQHIFGREKEPEGTWVINPYDKIYTLTYNLTKALDVTADLSPPSVFRGSRSFNNYLLTKPRRSNNPLVNNVLQAIRFLSEGYDVRPEDDLREKEWFNVYMTVPGAYDEKNMWKIWYRENPAAVPFQRHTLDRTSLTIAAQRKKYMNAYPLSTSTIGPATFFKVIWVDVKEHQDRKKELGIWFWKDYWIWWAEHKGRKLIRFEGHVFEKYKSYEREIKHKIEIDSIGRSTAESITTNTVGGRFTQIEEEYGFSDSTLLFFDYAVKPALSRNLKDFNLYSIPTMNVYWKNYI